MNFIKPRLIYLLILGHKNFKKIMSKLLYVLCAVILFSNLTMSQNLNDKFKSYKIVNLESSKLKSSILTQRSDEKKIVIDKWEISLFNSDIISPKYKLRVSTSGGVLEEKSSLPLAMNGYTREGYRASITINDGFIYGFVKEGSEVYSIEPLAHYGKNYLANQFIIYRDSDIINKEEHKCGAHSGLDVNGKDHDGHGASKRMDCLEVEYAIANDFLMFQSYGSVTSVENHAIGVLNDVQTNYDDEFNDELSFSIVEQFVSNCSTCDPWTNSTDAEALLNSFTNWAPGGFSSGHDIGSIWTNRNFDGSTIGIAWLGAICTSSSYNALEDFSSNANLKRVMVSHEFGHNFDADHDANNSPHIMAPAVQNTTSWSTASINAIQNFYNSINCLSFCSGGGGAPNAQFAYQIVDPCATTTVEFTNQSTGTNLTYEWEFPGGIPTTSTAQNPIITYENFGTYSATLTVTSPFGSSTFEVLDEIIINEIPEPVFDFSVNNSTASFFNQTANPNAVLLWQFGDGFASSQTNPVHTYSNDGIYTVTLIAENGCGLQTFSADVEIATPPTAGFTVNQNTGCQNFNVNFVNTSSSNSVNYSWQFPGGIPNTSNQQNPNVLYTNPGSYNVSLTVSNGVGTNTLIQNNFIIVVANPTSAFTYTQAGLTYTFTNTSSNASSYLWNFGDGNTSTIQNPVHTYNNPGTYTVTLISDNDACNEVSSNQTINAVASPVSSFTSNSNTGCAPLNVQFTSTSQNNPTTYSWTFQGGSPATSNVPNPLINYTQAGSFNVTLVTSNSQGSNTLSLDNYVQVSTTPISAFTSSNSGLTYNFVNNSSSNSTSFLWTFGDGNTSTEVNPVHTYSQQGSYNVTLSASNACGSQTANNTVNVILPPTAQFSGSANSVCSGETINFTDNSQGIVTARSWIFDGGSPSTSTLENVSVLYQQSGSYNVTLIVSNSAGNDTLQLNNYVNVNSIPNTTFNHVINNNTIILTNTSVNYNSLLWTLPDGTTSNQNVVSYPANNNGSYSFTLTSTNNCGSSSSTQIVNFNSLPVAAINSNFSSSGVNCTPLQVQYNATENSGSTYSWTFNGGNPSTSGIPNPVVLYPDSGSYNVQLIVTNTLGSDTSLLTNYITLNDGPDGDYTYSIVGEREVNFNYLGEINNTLLWNFAGQATSTITNPTHKFTSSGTYAVSLLLSNECGQDTILKNVVINLTSLNEIPISSYKIYPNPVRQTLYLTQDRRISGQQIKSEIFDAFGRSILEMEIDDKNNSINVENLLNGQYILKLINGEETSHLKFIKI